MKLRLSIADAITWVTAIVLAIVLARLTFAWMVGFGVFNR